MRIEGLDVARAVAILGMLIAHLGTGHNVSEPGWGNEWMWFFDGRSSALFAVLAGVSITLMSRSARAVSDPVAARPAWRGVRAKIAVRAVLITVIGIALQLLGTPVAIILPSYAVLFLMALPVLRVRTEWLALLAVGAVTLGPILVLGVRQATTGGVEPTLLNFAFGIGEFIWGYYPAAVWIGYLLVGMMIGRHALSSSLAAAALTVGGILLAVASYGGGAMLGARLGLDPTFWPDVLFSTVAHSTSPFEVVGNTGVACAVIGLCLLITRWRPLAVLLSPLAATGSMALTVYVVQILVIALMGSNSVWYPESNLPLLSLALGSILAATLWRATLGRGPLERLLTTASDAAARSAARGSGAPLVP